MEVRCGGIAYTCEMSFGLLVLLIGVVCLLLSIVGELGYFDRVYSDIWLVYVLWFFLYDLFYHGRIPHSHESD